MGTKFRQLGTKVHVTFALRRVPGNDGRADAGRVVAGHNSDASTPTLITAIWADAVAWERRSQGGRPG